MKKKKTEWAQDKTSKIVCSFVVLLPILSLKLSEVPNRKIFYNKNTRIFVDINIILPVARTKMFVLRCDFLFSLLFFNLWLLQNKLSFLLSISLYHFMLPCLYINYWRKCELESHEKSLGLAWWIRHSWIILLCRNRFK